MTAKPWWKGRPGTCYEVGMVRRISSIFAIFIAAACTTPTLPLPPPTAPEITTGLEPDTVKLSSVHGSEPDALVIVINRNPSLARDKRVSDQAVALFRKFQADETATWEKVIKSHNITAG